MDGGRPDPTDRPLIELSAGSDVERWPVELAQSRVSARLLPSLLTRLGQPGLRAA